MQKSNICKKCLLVFQASTYYIRRRFCLIHFYCGQVKKTTLDLPSSAIVVLHLLLVALIDCRHSGIVGEKQKRLVNIPSTSLQFFLLSY